MMIMSATGLWKANRFGVSMLWLMIAIFSYTFLIK